MRDKVFIDTNIWIYLYSEDLHHGHVIDKQLTIINPFI